MVMIEVDEKHRFYLHAREKAELDVALDAMKYNNQDLLIVISGPEGAAKSTRARQYGFYCASRLGSVFDRDGVSNIHNDLDTYIKGCFKGGKFSVHILDEGRKVLNRKRSMAKEPVRFTNFISECRSMNLVHIICVPTYHDLDQYIVRWRMTFLVRMEKSYVATKDVDYVSGYRLDLGAYKFFVNDDWVKIFYDQFPNYPKVFIARDRMGSYPACEVLTKKGLAAYESQKNKLMKEKYYDGDTEAEFYKKKLLQVADASREKRLVNKDIAEIIGVSEMTISRWKRSLEKDSPEVLT